MNPYLVDANVWLALLVKEHVHHVSARRWFDTLTERQAGLCRVVQLALIRLLGNGVIMQQGVLSASAAYSRISELLEDSRVEFLAEPPNLATILPGLFRYAVPTNNMVTDAYLAAFAIAASCRLVTRDRGFQQFRGLDVELL